VGDRVFGMARTHGSYAEHTAISPAATMEPLAKIPDGVADDQAAALPTAAVTALRAIDLLEVAAGERVVVMGATGGVGGYAVQMARSRGARVIATVRGDDGEASRLGADEVFDSQAVEAQRQITAHNHSSRANPLISPQGLTTVGQLLADGTITTRIGSTVDLDAAGQVLEELRHGGLHGKAVIRL
jgi:NADPH:quinone reductase-like Zn-dependent oxidoreductase